MRQSAAIALLLSPGRRVSERCSLAPSTTDEDTRKFLRSHYYASKPLSSQLFGYVLQSLMRNRRWRLKSAMEFLLEIILRVQVPGFRAV